MLTSQQLKMALSFTGISCAELGAKVGVTGQTVGAYVRGKGINSRTVGQIETYLKQIGVVIIEPGEPSLTGGLGIRFKS